MYAWVWGCWNWLCVFVLWLAVSAEQQHLKKLKACWYFAFECFSLCVWLCVFVL